MANANNLVWTRIKKVNACGEESIDRDSYKVIYKCGDGAQNKFVDLNVDLTSSEASSDTIVSRVGQTYGIFNGDGSASDRSIKKLVAAAEASAD